ncbi:hypothetical protein E3N88_19840 [Mikania micrantha]|uniref:Uncharacterized protein n=1 Tax=Mikania micrantha TaxID=192012 RepID=A0A5N6NQ10_9ASTR|nr:hypothetical protein E3N88_19840 [Mikania micrantha]
MMGCENNGSLRKWWVALEVGGAVVGGSVAGSWQWQLPGRNPTPPIPTPAATVDRHRRPAPPPSTTTVDRLCFHSSISFNLASISFLPCVSIQSYTNVRGYSEPTHNHGYSEPTRTHGGRWSFDSRQRGRGRGGRGKGRGSSRGRPSYTSQPPWMQSPQNWQWPQQQPWQPWTAPPVPYPTMPTTHRRPPSNRSPSAGVLGPAPSQFYAAIDDYYNPTNIEHALVPERDSTAD